MAYRDSTYVSGDFDFYLFAKNVQGDILYIYNTSGTRLVTYTYDAWGKCYVTYQNGGASTAARYNPFRYRGLSRNNRLIIHRKGLFCPRMINV